MRRAAWWTLTLATACAGDPASEVPEDSGLMATTSDTESTGDTATSPSSGTVPTTPASLDTWLADGAYLAWAAESGPHPSAGPHFGEVRTYVDPLLAGSLSAGSDEHPLGATAVKELYGDGTEVRGYSVMVKIGQGTDGASWYWYEVYDGVVYGDGRGDRTCTGCHRPGTDYVLTPYPLP